MITLMLMLTLIIVIEAAGPVRDPAGEGRRAFTHYVID